MQLLHECLDNATEAWGLGCMILYLEIEWVRRVEWSGQMIAVEYADRLSLCVGIAFLKLCRMGEPLNEHWTQWRLGNDRIGSRWLLYCGCGWYAAAPLDTETNQSLVKAHTVRVSVTVNAATSAFPNVTVNNNTFCFATIDKVFYYVASVLTILCH
jgi:hypothetical protein